MNEYPEQKPPGTITAQQLADMQEGFAAIIERTTAYRAALLDQDYSPTAAEQMTVEFHALLLRMGSDAC